MLKPNLSSVWTELCIRFSVDLWKYSSSGVWLDHSLSSSSTKFSFFSCFLLRNTKSYTFLYSFFSPSCMYSFVFLSWTCFRPGFCSCVWNHFSQSCVFLGLIHGYILEVLAWSCIIFFHYQYILPFCISSWGNMRKRDIIWCLIILILAYHMMVIELVISLSGLENLTHDDSLSLSPLIFFSFFFYDLSLFLCD